MKDEIKEILDSTLEYLEGIDETRNTKILTTNETNILLDYITNLQEEVDKLTAESTEWESKCYDLQKENEKLKKRVQIGQNAFLSLNNKIDKAIEYIVNNDELYYGDELYDSYKKIINILKGEDD